MPIAPDHDPWPPSWTPLAVIAALEPLVLPERQAKLQTVVAERLQSVAVLLDSPCDPHNIAAVMRSCDAFGVHSVHVIPGSEALLPLHKISQGSERWVECVAHPNAEAAVSWLLRADYTLVATHPEGELLPERLSTLPRVALLFGNESTGLSPTVAAAATHQVRVPMRGFVTSLNLSVAAGLLLHSATRGRPGDLTAEQRDRVYARGLYRSVSHAAEILDNSRAF